MESNHEKERNGHDITNVSIKQNAAIELPNQYPKNTPTLQRKVSKRRQAQQQRTIVLDIFKELISKVNQSYSKIVASQNTKIIINKPARANKFKNRVKQKEPIVKELKEIRPREESLEENRVKYEQKDKIWSHYSQLMAYQILIEEPQIIQKSETL